MSNQSCIRGLLFVEAVLLTQSMSFSALIGLLPVPVPAVVLGTPVLTGGLSVVGSLLWDIMRGGGM